MKTPLFVLLLSCLAVAAQTPPSPPTPGASTLTNREQLLREAVRRGFGSATNTTAQRNPPAPSALAVPGATAPGLPPPGMTAAAPSSPAPPEEIFLPAGNINWKAVDVNQVLDVYADLVGRTILRPANLPAPTIVLKTQTALTKREAIMALDAVLSLNGIAMINVGDKFVKAVPTTQANQEGAPIHTNDASQLAELGQYVTHVVQLKYIKPSEIMAALTPFQKMAGGILPIDGSQILVLRDNTENVKRMLEMIKQIDVLVPAEYVSEVIPIKYAKAEDIASALNSVSGGGGGSSFGTRSSSPARSSGAAGATGMTTSRPGMPGYTPGQTTPGTVGQPAAGTPSSTSTFSARLNSIIQNAAASGEIQILGKTKIIADLRSNSLLVFATRPDMDTIKDIVGKLDVVLAQVLIETIIMDVDLNHSWNYGISAGQQPKQSGNVLAGGMVNNDNGQLPTGSGFLHNLMSSITTNALGSNVTSFGSSQVTPYPSSSGLNYFGTLGAGPSFDVALQAAASDNTINVIQKPRILTLHATPAYLFVGGTVPYVSSTYYGGGYNGGPSSSYQQLPIGIGLNVTPFINPDGLVVMQIDESIDEISGSTAITGVGNVPNTTHRQLTAEVAVRDRETIILGGFIRNSDTKSRSGVPILQDIPILGNLFTSRGSAKERTELLVLMRPTVLRTPELAAKQVAVEEQRLPGVLRAKKDYDADELTTVKQEPQKGFREVTPVPATAEPPPTP